MTPVLLEYPRPLVKRTNRVRVGAIEHLPAIAPEAHEPDVPQHLEVLGHRRLTELEVRHDVADVTFLRREVDEDVATLRFSDRVEDVGCRRSASHEANYIPTTEYVNSPGGQTPVMRRVGVRPRVRDDSTYAIYEMLRA